MMKLSTRSTYGMRALVELALASGRAPLSAALIAKRQELSVAYLEQLLHRLKRHGLVTSIRGPRGGYLLAKDPRQITMADVVQILDGFTGAATVRGREGLRRALANGKAAAGPSRAAAKEAHRRAHRMRESVHRCVHERLTQSLSEVTLQDLCDDVGSEIGEPLDHRYVFHI